MFCKPLERSILRFWFSRRFRSRLRFSVMLDGHPILCDPPPSPLGQLMRIPYPFWSSDTLRSAAEPARPAHAHPLSFLVIRYSAIRSRWHPVGPARILTKSVAAPIGIVEMRI